MMKMEEKEQKDFLITQIYTAKQTVVFDIGDISIVFSRE